MWRKVEVLPYHTLGVYKWKELGIPYQLEGIDPPSQERVENANRILETANIMHKNVEHMEIMCSTFL